MVIKKGGEWLGDGEKGRRDSMVVKKKGEKRLVSGKKERRGSAT